jgi:polyhydroxybutyrate depolymerase
MPIDTGRLTFVGHSNGGFMAHRLACEAPGRIAGIASLAGATFFDPGLCDAADTTSVLQIHGTFDTTIAYDGGQLFGRRFPSAEESVGFWADRAGCGAPIADGDGDYDNAVAGVETVRTTRPGCDADRDVSLWTMERSGHIPTVSDAFKEAVVDWLMSVQR